MLAGKVWLSSGLVLCLALSLWRIGRSKREREPSATYTFVFSTGRCGTQHLAKAFEGDPRAYVTHQEEHPTRPTKEVVNSLYRGLDSPSAADQHVRSFKLPVIQRAIRHGARRFLYTGHLPLAFGLGPALVENLPPGSVRILRLRRDRIQLASSLMALGPEEQDPWSPPAKGVGKLQHRWFPSPFDWHVKLRPPIEVWNRLNRFQRYLWYVDDTECRWQFFRNTVDFPFIEIQVESLMQLNGALEYKRMSKFLGIDFSEAEALKTHNSIQSKGRSKEAVGEELARTWDSEYRSIIGPCEVAPGQNVSWVPA